MLDTMAKLLPLSAIDPTRVETLLDRAFGTDRHSRTAYKLRTNSTAIAALSYALVNDNDLAASLQCWPVRIGEATLVLVGPVAVDPDHQKLGHGHRLMHVALEAATTIGNPAMVMIGDPEYYGRFGFSADATAGWTMPGPWEPHRLLARNVAGHSLPLTGMLERADAL
jgi:predicted N-acetyltransferase YhbS